MRDDKTNEMYVVGRMKGEEKRSYSRRDVALTLASKLIVNGKARDTLTF